MSLCLCVRTTKGNPFEMEGSTKMGNSSSAAPTQRIKCGCGAVPTTAEFIMKNTMNCQSSTTYICAIDTPDKSFGIRCGTISTVCLSPRRARARLGWTAIYINIYNYVQNYAICCRDNTFACQSPISFRLDTLPTGPTSQGDRSRLYRFRPSVSP